MTTFAIALVAISVILLIGVPFAIRRGMLPRLRRIEGYQTLGHQIGEAIESGGRVHIGLGSSTLHGDQGTTTIAALAMLELATGLAAINDRSPVTTTSDAATILAADEIIARAYRQQSLPERYEQTASRLVALDPIALAGGTTSIIQDDLIRSNIIIGSYGAELALIAEAGSRLDIPQTMGSDRLEAQAVAYGMANYPIIGEDIYAVRAYLSDSPGALAGLITEDLLRWAIVITILLGVGLASLGLLN